MPISDHWAVPWVVESISRIAPESLLDFGIGIGGYGLQLRQVLDIGCGRLSREQWKTRIEGVEVFERYRNPVWSYCYDRVHLEDGREFLRRARPGEYDVIVACDVIEHFRKDDALEHIALMRKLAPWVIITTPAGNYPQGACFGNDAETHRSAWDPADLRAMGGVTTPIGVTFITMFAADRQRLVELDLANLPILFRNTGRSLARCFARWFPRMIHSRFGPRPGAHRAPEQSLTPGARCS